MHIMQVDFLPDVMDAYRVDAHARLSMTMCVIECYCCGPGTPDAHFTIHDHVYSHYITVLLDLRRVLYERLTCTLPNFVW